MLETAPAADFQQPKHEWRRVFSEAWGTFLLVVVASGAGVVGAQSGGAITLSIESRRAGCDGDGDHLFHGRGGRRPS